MKLQIWPHSLKKYLTENFIFCAMKLQKLNSNFQGRRCIQNFKNCHEIQNNNIFIGTIKN